ncbi:hypothetical protein BG003_000845 [Podila horticola]|nr:hypothetical protein BG003_000845 [Podila horticola]
MSFEPKEQPVYYSPAPGASSPATAVVGTPVYQYDQGQQQQLQGTPVQSTPVYQYDQAQQQQLQGTPVQGTPVQGTPVYQYAQTSPQQPNVLQQPYYPPADMQSPPPQHQQIYYAQQPVQQQVQQPNVAYTTAQAVEAPAVTTIPVAGNGRGLTGRMHQFDECCLCFPLHTGAMIISFLMVIFYGYCGLVLVAFGSFTGWYSAILICFGVLYLGVAVVSAFGFAGVYKERVDWVDRFIKMYIIGSIVWLVLQILSIIIEVIYYNQLSNSYAGYYYVSVGVNWVGFAITFVIGGLFQYYFACCLVSYQRMLHHRIESFDGQSNVIMAPGGVSYVQKDIAMA